MANSDEKLDKIADFLKNQESPNNEDHSYRDNKKLEKSEEALDQINKFLEDQSHFDERKESLLTL